jgi:hypothetical protein
VSISDYASRADCVTGRADIQLRLVNCAEGGHPQDQLRVCVYVCVQHC